MSLLTTLNEDIKTAMRAKDKVSLDVLRLLKASVQNEQIAKGTDLTSEEEISVVAREMKQRRDSLVEFEKANRPDLVATVQEGMAVVAKYLPQQLDASEIQTIVAAAIEKTGATSMKEFGQVMGIVMPQVKGKADGNLVNETVKQLLNS